ncbi:MAG: enoyl-CoA hydratase/isomerase family protein [Acidimicrobiia bacterium]|nr:enoyl-CoA hydratase/isomerase family protein [Acidimicrobiia bacterium]
MSLVDYTTEGAVALLTLNRPPVNALNAELAGDISAALTEAADPAIRAVVITGNKHFAAGADIARFVDSFDAAGDEEIASELFETIVQLENLAKPTIAAISGYALGGGLELAMGADFRYMAEDAKVGQPEIMLGIIPGAGGTQRLPRIVGYQRAKEMNLTGRHVGAEEAHAIGLADKVVPGDDLVPTAMADAATWADGPTLGYAAVKESMNDGWGKPILDALAVERRVFNQVFRTEDAKNGIRAFLAKEKPDFEGR